MTSVIFRFATYIQALIIHKKKKKSLQETYVSSSFNLSRTRHTREKLGLPTKTQKKAKHKSKIKQTQLCFFFSHFFLNHLSNL